MKLSIIFCFIFLLSFSQNFNKKADSLKLILNNTSLTFQDRVEVLNKLSLYYGEFDFNQARIINNQIYSISKRKKYSKGFGYFYMNLANNNMIKGNFQQAENMAKIAQGYFLKSKDNNNYILSIYANCFALDFQGKYNTAMQLALKTISNFESQPNNERIVELYYYLSTIYNDNKKPKTAFFYINKALVLYTKNKNENGIYKCNYQMATICRINGMYEKSIIYLDKCNKLLKSKFDNKIEFHIKLNLAYAQNYISLKNFNKALVHSRIFYKYVKKENIKNFEFENNFIFFKIFRNLKYNKLALVYMSLIDSNPKISEIELFEFNLEKGKFYLDNKEYAKAIFYGSKNYKIKPENIENLKLLAATAFELRNFEQAYFYQKQILKQNEIEYNLEKDNRISEYEALFQLKEKDLTIKNKNLQVANQEIEIQRQKSYVVIFLVILIALLAIFVLLIYNYQIKRKTNSLLNAKNVELNQLNQIVTASLKEKEVLLKEIHHRVKNNLQLVMSLLNIQAQDSQQVSIEDFLEKGQLRIATMSLIHQNLYLSDNFSNIDFQSYLESLVNNIKNTFDDNKVDIAIDTHGNTFDLDTAIPLGLIINEIVCNALKHAFPADMEGKIQIAIQKKESNLFELQIGDNGVGVIETKKSNSIGLELVSLLVMQLRGKMKKINQLGTNYCIEFKQSIEY